MGLFLLVIPWGKKNDICRSQKPEARSQKPEARSQKPEARSQKPEARSQGISHLLNTSVYKTKYSTIQGMSLTGHAFFAVRF